MKPLRPVGPINESEVSKAAHTKDDVDADTQAHHHTIGEGPNQAASGSKLKALIAAVGAVIAGRNIDVDIINVRTKIINPDAAENVTVDDHMSVVGDLGCLGTISAPALLVNGVSIKFGVITGEMKLWPLAAAPAGYLLCDGSVVSRTTYADLFAVISTNFNTGGEAGTDFRLPNLKGRVPVGRDTGQVEFDVMGEVGGAKTHTLTTAEIPSHTHTNYGTVQAADGAVRRQLTDSVFGNNNVASGATGGGGAHNNLQPYIVLSYIIKT